MDSFVNRMMMILGEIDNIQISESFSVKCFPLNIWSADVY